VRTTLAHRLALAGLLLMAGLVVAASGVQTAELVMFEDAACSWCRRWHAEIGPGYPHSEEGQRAPLRRVDIRDLHMSGVSLASPVRATPTFVLVEDGREVGRIVGYPGADFFYPRLEELLARLPPPEPEERRPSLRSTMHTTGACVL
jgi:hypothetical protein